MAASRAPDPRPKLPTHGGPHGVAPDQFASAPETRLGIANKISRGGVHSGIFYSMFDRDWLSHAAVKRGLIVGGALLALTLVTRFIAVPCCVEFARHSADQNQKGYSGEYDPSRCSDKQPWPVVFDKDYVPRKRPEQEAEPTKKECEDLKAQRRMALAAERTLEVGCYQLWLSIVGVMGLLTTIYYTGRATYAASQAANSARAAVAVAQDTATRELRAYVSAYPDFIYSFGVGGFPTARFKIHNTGATPAHRLNHRADVIVVSEPMPVGYRFPRLTVNTTPPIVAFPDLPMNGVVIGSVAMTKADIDRIVDGTARIYVFGQIFYADGFATEERVTQFCAFVSANRATLQKLTRNYEPDDLKVSFTAAPEGNDAT